MFTKGGKITLNDNGMGKRNYIYKVAMHWSVRVNKTKWQSRRAMQGRVEGQWSQLGRVEDLLYDQELVWRLLLLVFV